MTAIFRKSLVAGAIAALVSAPVWAQSATDQSTTGQTTGQPSEYQATPPGSLGTHSDSPAASQAGMQAATSGPLASMTPAQLRTMSVVDQAGEELGTVQSVVRNLSDQNIQLVISPAGATSGTKQVAVSLDEVNLMGEKLQLSTTRAEFEARPETQSQQYVELTPADQPISDFAAFEPVPGQENQQQQQWNTPASPGSGPSSLPSTPGSDPSSTPSSPSSGSMGSPSSPGTTQ